MNFKIRYDSRNRVVYLLLYGEATYANRMEAVRQLVGKYGHLKPLRVLADVRGVTQMSMTLEEQERLGRFVAQLPEMSGARIAMLNRRELNTTAVMRNKARENGLELFSFLTEATAMNWLTSSAEVPG
ncbi:hypothetical protein PVT68_07285 [Microbulbifer bruguierae]|uniref:STAS/SEC14 domain-containing protein n=1 Tax=Microbulbifer bruguierae TaxID=3029061 RepID=A0ABY8NGN6_9GAMM|nr:hypothetical protein [Microbulbifer bruguierae]WGL18089.1 hypothetical protein PVT68_07285 [Microbulbifer bruguierae]